MASTLLVVTSNLAFRVLGLAVLSLVNHDVLQPSSEALQPCCDGLQPTSGGL